MADTVEVVIKIPKDYYEVFQHLSDKSCPLDTLLIKHGTVLPKGHWKLNEVDGHCHCSMCGILGVDYWDYCPNCGAKMVADSEV